MWWFLAFGSWSTLWVSWGGDFFTFGGRSPPWVAMGGSGKPWEGMGFPLRTFFSWEACKLGSSGFASQAWSPWEIGFEIWVYENVEEKRRFLLSLFFVVIWWGVGKWLLCDTVVAANPPSGSLSLSPLPPLSRSSFLRFFFFFWFFIVFKRNNCVWVSWFWSVKQSLKNWRGMLLLVGVKPEYYTGSLLNLFSLRMYFSHLMKPCKY